MSDAPSGPETSARREEIRRLQAVTTSLLTRKTTPEQVFRHIVDGAADCLGADEASLMVTEGNVLRVVSARKADAEAASAVDRQPIPIGEGVAGWVVQSGEPLILNEGDDFSRFTNFASKGRRIRSALSVPLTVEGRVVGVLNANRLTGGDPFTEDDLAVLRLFGDTAALAIDQTSLLRTVQRRARAVQTLLSVTDAFTGDTEPEAALARLLPALAEALHTSMALAFLGTTEQSSLPAVARWAPPTAGGGLPSARAVLALTGDVAEAFERRTPTWTSTLPLEGGDPPAASMPPRLLVVPAGHAHSGPRGAIVLAWPNPDFELPRENLRLIEGLARQLELLLSRQDRAAVVGQLEAEMAQARQHLMEAERLAMIGQSMAGVVHDINAPLTAITAFAQLLQKDTAEPKTRERSAHIIEAAQRAQRLVRELLTMARPRPPAIEPVDVNQLLRVAMDLERPQCTASGIKLASAFDSSLPRVKADPHRLGQVFVNLLVNARQAMDSAGKGTAITVQTRRREQVIELRFTDDGPGIPAASKARIFDWFFTTKPPGEGTGLGLAISREILASHDGTMRVEDAAEGGASFVLELPLPASEPGS